MIYVGSSNKNSIFTGSKASEIFSGGVKVYPDKTEQEIVLFNGQTGEGQINTSLYGGFSTISANDDTSITYTDNNITLKSIGSDTHGTYQPYMGSVKQIDFTDVNKVIVNIVSTTAQGSSTNLYNRVVLNKQRDPYAPTISMILTKGECCLDVSNIDGLYYLIFTGGVSMIATTVIDYISLIKEM